MIRTYVSVFNIKFFQKDGFCFESPETVIMYKVRIFDF